MSKNIRGPGRPRKGSLRSSGETSSISMLASERDQIEELVEKLIAGGYADVSRSALLRGAILKIIRELPETRSRRDLQGAYQAVGSPDPFVVRVGTPGRGSDEDETVKINVIMFASEKEEVDILAYQLKGAGFGRITRSALLRGALLPIADEVPDNHPTPAQLQAAMDACTPPALQPRGEE